MGPLDLQRRKPMLDAPVQVAAQIALVVQPGPALVSGKVGRDGETDQRYAGLAQEERILDWLHDCYFSAVSGDAPAFEAW